MALFLNYGGNPNETNGHDQTCLHSVCMKSEPVEKRLVMLERLLEWRGDHSSSGEDKVSVNHVDEDGNIALHYAARNGLVKCVIALLRHGSIISLVNRDQLTCCDEADAAEQKSLADMLEAALVFQPEDEAFDPAELEGGNMNPIQAVQTDKAIVLDSLCLTAEDLYSWAGRAINLFKDVTNLPYGRVLAILSGYDWEVSRALQEYVMDPNSALKSARLQTPNEEMPQVHSSPSRTLTPEQAAITSKLNFGTADEFSSLDLGEIALHESTEVLFSQPLFTI